MIDQLLADAFNGFALRDIPFLIMQISFSLFITLIIRFLWLKATLDANEEKLVKMITPLQGVLTLVALFGMRSPWIAVLFGFFIIVIGNQGPSLSLRSRVLLLACAGAAWGCATNLFVTVFVYAIIILPLLYFTTAKK